MDCYNENIKRWITRPDVCRCCLSSSGSMDVTTSYISESGTKEIYSDMLLHCYGINLSHISDWEPSRMVCLLCVGQLRDACCFREQVLRAEKHFTDYYNSRENEELVKTEDDVIPSPIEDVQDQSNHDKEEMVKTEDDVIQCPEEAVQDQNDDNVENEIEQLFLYKDEVSKKKETDRNSQHPDIQTSVIEIVDVDTGYDSDVPIARLLKKNELSQQENKDWNKELCAIDTNPRVKAVPHRILNSVKHVSERKRGILTCNIVLTETTACPFRHHKSWFRCFFCSQGFVDINQLREHTTKTHADIDSELKQLKRYPRSLHIEISNLECRKCHLTLTDVSEMRRHLDEAHDKVIYAECIADFKLDVSPYSCHICNQQFHVFRTLTTHLNEHYANCICDVCGKSYLNTRRLKVHKRTHEAGIFPCAECEKVLKTKMSLSNHIENVHSNRQMKCQICFKPMKHYNERIKHMSEVHNITYRFQCPICSREFNVKHYLTTHIRQTHGHKNKKCFECDMAFMTNHGLKKHMVKHTGEKPYSCNVCGKGYVRSYSLKEHMMRSHETGDGDASPD